MPIQMTVAIGRLMRERDMTFAEAYARLLEAGAIVEISEMGEPG